MTGDVRVVLADELDRLRQIVAGVNDAEIVRATSCEGWSVADLLVHLRLDGEELLRGLTVPCDDPVDRDYVSYWKDWPASGPATFADVRWIWATAASYTTTDSLRSHFDEVMTAAAAVSRVAPGRRVRFQNHVLSIDDLLTMFSVEFAVHHLDLLVAVPDRPGPEPGALALAGFHSRWAPRSTTSHLVGPAHLCTKGHWPPATRRCRHRRARR